MKTAVFPGSFNPFTRGHQHIVERASALFDRIIIAIGHNMNKNNSSAPEERQQQIAQLYANDAGVEVAAYEGLTIDFCKQIGAKFIIRGLRSVADFEQEIYVAQANQMLSKDIETVFLLAQPPYQTLSSTIVREVLKHGGDAKNFLPQTL
jgi:pantetheine-phosphate adenylyltransferase